MKHWFTFYQEVIKTKPELFYQAGKISQILNFHNKNKIFPIVFSIKR